MNKEFERRHNEVLKILSLLAKEAGRLKQEIVFLGGSAVQAILKSPKRVSIDLDVYYSGNGGELVQILGANGYRMTERASRDQEMFEFYTAKKEDVLVKLDFLKMRVPDKYVFAKELTAAGQREKFTVKIARPEYLMAAKLSALAVGATGRKTGSKALELDLLKDVFDLDCMADEFPGLEEKICAAVVGITRQQNKLRKTAYAEKEVYGAAGKTLREIACISGNLWVTQGTLKNFAQYMYGDVGELARTELAVMAMRIFYRISAIERKEGVEKAEKAVKEKERDKAFVSECERKLAGAGESPAELHDFKVFAPKALIYLYYSKR